MPEITIKYEQYADIVELTSADQELLASALEATHDSYSPYSQLSVGAAVRLATGEIMSASNQENGAFPASLCAERSLLSYVCSNRKDVDIQTLAIVGTRNGDLVKNISPCGICRQFIAEISNKQQQPIKLIFFHNDKIAVLNNAADLLPLTFSL